MQLSERTFEQPSSSGLQLSGTSSTTLAVSGMRCAGCVSSVEQHLAKQADVVAVDVNLVTELAVVTYRADRTNPTALAQSLQEIGFSAIVQSCDHPAPDSETGSAAGAVTQPGHRQIWQLAIASILLVLSGLGHIGLSPHAHIAQSHTPSALSVLSNIWFHWGLATIAVIVPGRSFLADGWQGLRRLAPNMNTLVGLGVLTAYITSTIALLFPDLGWECFFDEPVMVIGFILLGRALEQQARNKASSAFRALIALQPLTAHLVTSDLATTEVPVNSVNPGSRLQVRAGEMIPVDGDVVAGQTTVDESMLTGESMPVLKQPGDAVSAGTMNQLGVMTIVATRTGQETTLARMVKLVQDAQTRKAPVQRLADTIAGYFTYIILGIAALTFLVWYTIGSRMVDLSQLVQPGQSLPDPLLLSLKLGIAVLVVACPCALGLATPTAILVGFGVGTSQGLLIRGGDVLEKVHQVTAIVFDKTGTLTSGCPIVTDCWVMPEDPGTTPGTTTIPPLSPAQLMQLAVSVEQGTHHPIANAIQHYAQTHTLSPLAADSFHTEPGYGVSATVNHQVVLLGTAEWLQRQAVTIPISAQAQVKSLAVAGKQVIYVAIAGRLAGLIAISDEWLPDARLAVTCLKQMGFRVMVLTGDQSPVVASMIAQTLDLPETAIVTGIKPGDKAEQIAKLQAQGYRVAMVGDGINDVPALVQADVGISVRSGTDVAIDAADIVLMRADQGNSQRIHLLDVVKSIQLSRATLNKVHQNLGWALIYNLLCVPLAAGALIPKYGIFLNPSLAAFMMALSSITVVTNSLLLRYVRFPANCEI